MEPSDAVTFNSLPVSENLPDLVKHHVVLAKKTNNEIKKSKGLEKG